MYSRLWWKEARTFWPIWCALGAVAVGVQAFLLGLGIPGARNGLLITLGLSWSMLHAFAVGAAALAGERETNTLVLLDTLPVGRSMLWTSKVSFALVTTLALALALTLLGAMGSSAFDPAKYPIGTLAAGYGVVLFEGIAWSLLWSVILDSALQAAALGLLSVGLVNLILSRSVDLWDPAGLAPAAPLRLALAAVVLAFSWVLFTRRPRATSWQRIGASLPARRDVAARAPQFRLLGRYGTRFDRLVWETVRVSWRTWLFLAAAAIALPAVAALGGASIDPGLPWFLFGTLGSVLAGVSVFGPLNRGRGYRFLVAHGVRPGMAWAARFVVWGVVMTILTIAAVTTMIVFPYRAHEPPVIVDSALWLCLLIAQGFVIGLFCGQVLPRNITAWVVACLAFALLVMPQAALASARMIPYPGLTLFPVLMLAISWAWSGDWMNDLCGAMRWLRLAAMMAAAGVLLVAVYIGYRAWSVPDVGPPPALVAAATPAPPIAPEQDAARDYGDILRRFNWSLRDEGPDRDWEVDEVVAKGWTTVLAYMVRWREAHQALIEPLRRAAAKPVARFEPLDLHYRNVDRRLFDLRYAVWLLGLDSAYRRSAGDLAGAWDDMRTVVRVSDQISRSGGSMQALFGMGYRVEALQWALAWTADPHQTPATLRAALADFARFPQPLPASDYLKVDYALIERIFRQAESDPVLLLSRIPRNAAGGPRWARDAASALYVPPWERERARRVVNLVLTEALRGNPVNLSVQDRRWTVHNPQSALSWYWSSTPAVRPFWWLQNLGNLDDPANLLLGRAFEQVAALRIWQLEHDGQYPESLAALVPGILPSLPLDPYSGKSFLYRRSKGQALLPLGLSAQTSFAGARKPGPEPTRPGQWLLYSVGPNQVDDGAQRELVNDYATGDLVFPLPER